MSWSDPGSTFDRDPVTLNMKVLSENGHSTLSKLDLCYHKLEEVETWHRYFYHGLVVQCHGQTWIQPVTLTL